MFSSLRQALFACIQGGRGPRHAAMAAAFGALAGSVTGWNLTLAGVLLLAGLLNLRTKIFVAAWAIAGTAAWLASGLTYRVGQFLLDGTSLGAAIGALGDSLWIAMLDWDRYTTVGGAAIGLAMALPLAKLVAALAPAAPQRVAASRLGWLRPHWYLAVACVMALVAAAPWRLGPILIERELLRQLAAVNGAPVEAREVSLSLWSGELEIEDLQFVDPQRLDRDRLRIGLATTRVHPGALVRGRLAAGKLTLVNLHVDVARRQAADSHPSPRAGTKAPYSPATPPSFSTGKHELDIDTYVRNWSEIRERLRWLGRVVAGAETLVACDSTEGAWPGESLKLRSDLTRPQPRVRIESLRAEELPHAWGLGRKSVVEVAGLTSRPSDEELARVEISAPEFTAEIFAELRLQKPGRRHKLRVAAYDCQLSEWAEPAAANQAVVVSGGKFDLQGEGWMTRERLELGLQIDSKPLDVRVASHDRLAGIEGTIWDQGLRRLGGLRLEAKLAGPWNAPVLSVDAQRLVAQFKHQLRAASEHELVQSIESQLASNDAVQKSTKEQVAAAAAPPVDPRAEAAQGAASEPNSGEFCTVTDDAPPASAPNPFDGWRRARTAAEQPAVPYQYPRTAAPDSDPADRFIATLDKPTAARAPADVAARREAAADPGSDLGFEVPRIERTSHVRPETAAGEATSSRKNRPLPGPINLVVGRQDQPSLSEAELNNWPDESSEAEEIAPAAPPTPQRASPLSRWADGVREKLRRAWPSRRTENDFTLPPNLESEPPPGDEALIDEALDPPPATSAKPTWFQRLWR